MGRLRAVSAWRGAVGSVDAMESAVDEQERCIAMMLAGRLAESRIRMAAALGSRLAGAALAAVGGECPNMTELVEAELQHANPHGLDLPPALVRLNALVLVAAAGGESALCMVAADCATAEAPLHRDSTHRALRDSALACLSMGADTGAEAVEPDRRAVVEEMRRRYSEAGEGADEREAERVWYALGAPWFALETVLQDWAPIGREADALPDSTDS